MATPLSLHLRTDDPGNALATAIGSYDDHLQAGRYGLRRRRYLASVIHFGQWLSEEGWQRAMSTRA